jgi:hypothetical protein
MRRLLSHLLFWAAVTIFFFFVFRQGNHVWRTLRTNVGFMPAHLIFVYSLLYLVVPRFMKGKVWAGILLLLVTVAVSHFYLRVSDVYVLHYSGSNRVWKPDTIPRSIYVLFSVGWIAVSIKMGKTWYLEKERRQLLEKEHLTAELRSLKAQLHPHFLFNTLNGLYALTLEGSPQAPGVILKLSALLRYILYECNEPLVDLEKEKAVMLDYFELIRLRFGDRVETAMNFTGDTQGGQVPPLLFLPLIENSFKHGTAEELDKSWINGHLHMKGNTLHFQLINSRRSGPVIPGLGLQNVERRLQLLYPGRHTLKINAEEETFQVSLSLQCSPAL